MRELPCLRYCQRLHTTSIARAGRGERLLRFWAPTSNHIGEFVSTYIGVNVFVGSNERSIADVMVVAAPGASVGLIGW